MAVNIRGRNYLKLLDYTPEEIRYLLDLSKQFKNMKRNGVPHKYLDNRNIVLLFEKTSTRTRCAFEVAGRDLGMGVTYLDPGSSQMGKKESIADTARVLGRMYDGIEYRGACGVCGRACMERAYGPVPSHPDAGRPSDAGGEVRLPQRAALYIHGRCKE